MFLDWANIILMPSSILITSGKLTSSGKGFFAWALTTIVIPIHVIGVVRVVALNCNRLFLWGVMLSSSVHSLAI